MELKNWHFRTISGKRRVCGEVEWDGPFEQDHISAPLVDEGEGWAKSRVREYTLVGPEQEWRPF